jgi:CRP-like cAMP-binding protein
LTPLRYAQIERDAIDDLMLKHPRVAQALWWATLVSAAVQREWTLNIGQRSALERISHLFCELFYRLRGVGLTIDHCIEVPLTQTELADAVGLTPVHVNRTLQDMRAEGLIKLDRSELQILDLERLEAVAFFNPNYLHLHREGAHLDANE